MSNLVHSVSIFMSFRGKTIVLNVIHIFCCQEKSFLLIIDLNIISNLYQVKEKPERMRYISWGCKASELSRGYGDMAPTPENLKILD